METFFCLFHYWCSRTSVYCHWREHRGRGKMPDTFQTLYRNIFFPWNCSRWISISCLCIIGSESKRHILTRVMKSPKMSPRDLFDKGTSLIWLLACGRLGNKPLLYQWWCKSLFHMFRNSAPMNQWVKVSSIVHRIFVILYDKLVEWSLSFCGDPFLFQNWQSRISLHYHWSIVTKTKWRTPLRRYFFTSIFF